MREGKLQVIPYVHVLTAADVAWNTCVALFVPSEAPYFLGMADWGSLDQDTDGVRFPPSRFIQEWRVVGFDCSISEPLAGTTYGRFRQGKRIYLFAWNGISKPQRLLPGIHMTYLGMPAHIDRPADVHDGVGVQIATGSGLLTAGDIVRINLAYREIWPDPVTVAVVQPARGCFG
jgi:hypothetical protein